MSRSSLAAAMLYASLPAMISVRPVGRPADEPLPDPAPVKPTNLPGETNRAFAARMKATTNPDSVKGEGRD